MPTELIGGIGIALWMMVLMAQWRRKGGTRQLKDRNKSHPPR